MKEEQVFFVGVEKDIELRRNILESLKDAIESLQVYERLRPIREEKTKNMVKLRGIMREISGLVNDMKSLLPKTGLKIEPKHKEVEREVKKIIEEPKITELERLGKELRNIEAKLNNLA